MKIVKKEYITYVIIIFIIWIVIAIQIGIVPKEDKKDSDISLTDVKFIDIRKKANNIPEDTIVNFYYRLVNIGDSDLKIGYINPDCSCTKCYAIDSVVPPGDSTVIVMMFNTKYKLGLHKLNTVVKLNTPTMLYKISAMVDVISKNIIK